MIANFFLFGSTRIICTLYDLLGVRVRPGTGQYVHMYTERVLRVDSTDGAVNTGILNARLLIIIT